jgi:hypothetical protein
MAGPEMESRAMRTGPQQIQQGTYSLFSSSPWSVPLSTADNKSKPSTEFCSIMKTAYIPVLLFVNMLEYAELISLPVYLAGKVS